MKRPNILFVMTDDHAAHALSAYGSVINQTPHLDRIAAAGVRCDAAYCTNAICTPSRGSILTGQHTHVCGVRTLHDHLDNRHDPQLQRLLKAAGYRTAIFGKWHLGSGPNPDGTNSDPNGFDDWAVLPGQGDYYDPTFYTGSHDGQNSVRAGTLQATGYVTDLITDMSLRWLDRWQATTGEDEPFFLCVHHKAPHREWEPGPQEKHLYDGQTMPEPETLFDDYATRPAAAAARMRIDQDLQYKDVKANPPAGLSPRERKLWYYDRYIKDYLRCVAGVDRNVGRLLDKLQAMGLMDDTVVVYTSDQGFFLGDHGWYDKRFIYEHSFRMPLLVSYPRKHPAGTTSDAFVTNVDFAPTLLQFAGVETPAAMQGRSAADVLVGDPPADGQQSVYYRYWMDAERTHHTTSHYGVRTRRHKLVYFYADPLDCTGSGQVNVGVEPYWELYDLTADPNELTNIYGRPGTEAVTAELKAELARLQKQFADEPQHAE
ncbi:MAG: sulfatase [Phycisphaerae bacterium]